MINQPMRIVIPPTETASIHLDIPVEEMRHAFPQALAELSATLEQQDVRVIGPRFAHHLHRPTDRFDFYVCIPVERPVTAANRVEPLTLPALPVIQTTYHGDYAGLPHAWNDFISAIQADADEFRGDFLEAYTVGPAEAADPSSWKTELSVVLRKATA